MKTVTFNHPVHGTIELAESSVLEVLARKESDSYTDDEGTVWERPTAWAYAQVCKARDKWQALADERGTELEAIGAGGVNGKLMPGANADRETLMRSIVQAGQRAGIIRADLESASVSECLHILECLGQPAAPVSAEPSFYIPHHYVDEAGGKISKRVDFALSWSRKPAGVFTTPVFLSPVATQAQPDIRHVAVPCPSNPNLSSDRDQTQIMEALRSANDERQLAFSAKEIRGLLNTIKNQQTRIERFEAKSVHPLSGADTDVRKILLDVVPGLDGMGHEVYAKSVGDVENALTKMAQELEEWELGIRRHPDTTLTYNQVLEDAASTLEKRRNLLIGQNVVLDIQEGVALYNICIEAVRGLMKPSENPSLVDDKSHPRFLAGYDAGMKDAKRLKPGRPTPLGVLVLQYFELLDRALDLDKSPSAWVHKPKGSPQERMAAWQEVHAVRREIKEFIG